MADTKISALTTDTAPDRTADYVPTYDASAVATKKVLLSNLGGYYITAMAQNFSPADATTYYMGVTGVAGATESSFKIYIPRAGKITKARIMIAGTNGTSETSTMSIRLNATTDTTISSTVALNALPYTAVNSALSIAVAEDDYISVKWATPTWVTNPTGLYIAVYIWVT